MSSEHTFGAAVPDVCGEARRPLARRIGARLLHEALQAVPPTVFFLSAST